MQDDFEDLAIDFPELRESILKRSDHMDVTEYDKHTRRRTTMRAEMIGKEDGDITMIEDLASRGDASESNPSQFSFAPSPVVSDGPEAGGGSTRPFTASSKRRITEMFSTVKVMNDRMEMLSEQQRKLQGRIQTLDAKIDKLLIKG